MNKGDLINAVANIVNTKKTAQEVVDCVLTSITSSLKKGEDVSLTGFGTFKVVKRKARKGRNPATGEEIKIPAKTVVKMRLLKGCSEAILPPVPDVPLSRPRFPWSHAQCGSQRPDHSRRRRYIKWQLSPAERRHPQVKQRRPVAVRRSRSV